MTAEEDRLRQVLRDALRDEAAGLRPAGDGLAVIRRRVSRRRKARLVLLPAGAVAVAGAVLAFFVLGGTAGTSALVQDPAGSPSTAAPQPSTSPTGQPTTAPTQAPPVQQVTTPALWPFTTSAEAATWGRDHGSRPWAGDPLEVASHFLQDFLTLEGLTTSHPGKLQDLVAARDTGGREVARLHLVSFSVLGGSAWTVSSVTGGDLTIANPRAGGAISSPAAVTGRVNQVDENVALRLLSSAGKEIASSGAPAGRDVPWSGTLTWSDTSWTVGGIVAVTRSAKDGNVTRVAVQPVTRATGASASGASFVAVTGGHVSLYDASDGRLLRQLTFPPKGSVDTYATWSAGTLAWVRKGPGSCSYSLNRLDGGKASTVIEAQGKALSAPQLSPSGGLLAWAQTGCASSTTYQVVVSGGGAPARMIDAPAGQQVAVLDVRDDGALLLALNDAGVMDRPIHRFVPPGAVSLDMMRGFEEGEACHLLSALAFDDSRIAAFEWCGGSVRLVQYDASATRTGAAEFVKGTGTPEQMSVRDHVLLVTLDINNGVGRIARYWNGGFSTVLSNAGCAASSCVGLPDW